MTLVPLDPRDAPAWTVRADDGRELAVFRVGDESGVEFRVTDAVCPHNKGPLAQGWVRDGGTLVCPWHWYRFDLATGACATTPQYRLRTYPVVERDGRWFAEVGAPPVARSWAERLRAHARGER
ncbi:Rieske (2Fe-2S) protein [Pseudonocardia sp. CA-107938]|uniref:Rieske (2Fe-2S) protein n=1 Tax=Pseudonocardia sp. CA-107938 TaxID=3240021 RepID=UPI003D92EA04